ncbi:ArsR/SmtB family transcription factor [Actinoallomurus iriomotensis]|uniref:ArsR family transcriptional regulator n=1 Tax=Actinoallomurus iriomotensis TaxID=478107 RepID=A0A9W6W4X5_9ACTN|nr:helix-turn-helix domain-containing protein [Actinoallomurus iriomotensis]GLY89451.1 hypothetical protein Airi02_073800 [Actinoallomurus iriomotensis]
MRAQVSRLQSTPLTIVNITDACGAPEITGRIQGCALDGWLADCPLFIADKLGVSRPTCGEHMKILSQAGLVRGTKIKQWVFYRRDEGRIAEAKELLSGDW